MKKRIIGGLLLLVASLLVGCSTVRLAYDNGPMLVWWRVDSYLDVARDQRAAVRGEIDRWFAWHRSTQLPAYGAVLQQAQQQIAAPTTPEAVCRWNETLRQQLEPALERAVQAAAELLPLLRETNVRQLEKRYEKTLQEMQRDYLQADPDQRRQASLQRAVERTERIYGRLDPAQHTLLREGLAELPLDPVRWRDARQQQQQAVLQALRQQLAAPAAAPEQRLAVLRGLVQTDAPTEAADRERQQRLEQANCVLMARLHNSTTPAQREHARALLQGWEKDLRSLSDAPSAAS